MATPLIIDNGGKAMESIASDLTAADEAFAKAFNDLRITLEKNSQNQLTDKAMQTLLQKHFGEIPSRLIAATIRSLEDGKLKEALRSLSKTQRYDAAKEKIAEEKKNDKDKSTEKLVLDFIKDQEKKFEKNPNEKKIEAEKDAAEQMTKAATELEKSAKKTASEKELDNISKLKQAKSNLKSHSLFSNTEDFETKLGSKLADQTNILSGKALQKFATTSIGSKLGGWLVGKKEQDKYSIDKAGRYRRKDEDGKSKIISKSEFEESKNWFTKTGRITEKLGKESSINKKIDEDKVKEAERELLYGSKRKVKKNKESKEESIIDATGKEVKKTYKELEKPLDKSKGFIDVSLFLKSIEVSTRKALKVQQDIYEIFKKKEEQEEDDSPEGRKKKDAGKVQGKDTSKDEDDDDGSILDWFSDDDTKKGKKGGKTKGKRKVKSGKNVTRGKTPGKPGMFSKIGGLFSRNKTVVQTGGSIAVEEVARKQLTKQAGKKAAQQAGKQVAKQATQQVAKRGLIEVGKQVATKAGPIGVVVGAGILAAGAIEYQKEEIANAEAEAITNIGDRKLDTKKALIRQLKKNKMDWKIANKIDTAKNDSELDSTFKDVMSQIQKNKEEKEIKEKTKITIKQKEDLEKTKSKNIAEQQSQTNSAEVKVKDSIIKAEAEKSIASATVVDKKEDSKVKEIGAQTEAEAQKAKNVAENGKILSNQVDVMVKLLELVEIIAKKDFSTTSYGDTTSGPRYSSPYIS